MTKKKVNEIECNLYTEIVQYFDENDDPVNREIFRNKNLLTLMDELKQDAKTQEMVKNSIVTMNALIDEKMPADLYSARGHASDELDEEDRKSLKKNLEYELLY